MPLNDPINGRKVAPESLAFDPSAQRGISAVTYQQELTENVTIIQSVGGVTREDLSDKGFSLSRLVMQAKKQIQKWASIREHTYEWNVVTGNSNVTTKTWDALDFRKEIIRAMGAQTSGIIGTANAQWLHRCAHDQQGTWYVHCFIIMTLTPAMAVTKARLALFLNGTMHRVVDAIEVGYVGANPIIQCKLQGSLHVPISFGDVYDWRIFLFHPGTGGDQTISAPTSIYGYCDGHRVECEYEYITPTDVDNGSSYLI